MSAELETRLKSATELGATDVPGAAAQLKGLVLEESSNDAEAVRIKEQAISQLCELYIKQANAQALADLLTSLRGFFNAIPKAKTAKLVRSIIDSIAKVPGSTQLQVRGRRGGSGEGRAAAQGQGQRRGVVWCGGRCQVRQGARSGPLTR